MISTRHILLPLLVLLLLLLPNRILSDRLPIPIPPIPLEDNAQLAIIGWNGTHEVLILSTIVKMHRLYTNGDVPNTPHGVEYPQTEGGVPPPPPSIPIRIPKVYLMELIPFKSVPEAKRASERAFWVLGRYFIKFKFTPLPLERSKYKGVDVIWERKIGVHQIALVEAHNSEDLIKWATEYAKKYGVMPPSPTKLRKYVEIFEDYLERGYKYTAIDIVEVKVYSMLVEPIKYIFRSSYIYYPLKVSNAYNGKAVVRIYLVVKDELNLDPVISMGFREIGRVELNYDEVYRVDKDLANLFRKDGRVKVILLEYRGDSKFDRDIELRQPGIKDYFLSTIAYLIPIPLIIIPLILYKRGKYEKN